MRTGLSIVYVGMAVLANWLASRYLVVVPLTGGDVAPAGVFCIGAILVLRDWIQQLAGTLYSLALVPAGGAISYIVAEAAGWATLEQIALASVVAFVVSESVEALVFAPVRRRRLTVAVALSATVGNALDSFVFLWLAFGSLAFFPGQFWGKTEAIAVGVGLTLLRRVLVPVPSLAA